MNIDLLGPLAVGTTNKHWASFAQFLLFWHKNQGDLDAETFSTSTKQLDTLSSGTPEPSLDKFKRRALPVIPPKAREILSNVPEKFWSDVAHVSVIKENNSFALKKYVEYLDAVKTKAISHKHSFQKLDGKITTVGCQLAQFYSNLKQILGLLAINRRYIEAINNDTNLIAFSEGHTPEQLNFLASHLQLSEVITFSSANQNWFITIIKDLANWLKGVIKYLKGLHIKDQAVFDFDSLVKAENFVNSAVSLNFPNFGISFDEYSNLLTQTTSAFTILVNIIHTIKFNRDKLIAGITEADKEKFMPFVDLLYEKIFGHR